MAGLGRVLQDQQLGVGGMAHIGRGLEVVPGGIGIAAAQRRARRVEQGPALGFSRRRQQPILVTIEFRVTRNRDEVVTLYPETRRFTTPPMDTTEAGIRSGLRGRFQSNLPNPYHSGWYAAPSITPWSGDIL